MTPAERDIIINAAVDARIARMRAAVICGMDSPAATRNLSRWSSLHQVVVALGLRVYYNEALYNDPRYNRWFEPYYELENPAASAAPERPSAGVAERP